MFRLLLPFLLPVLVYSSVTLTPEGHGCCRQVTVQVRKPFVHFGNSLIIAFKFFFKNAIGVYAELNGIYALKEDATAELQPECVDGCIYRQDLIDH